MKVSNKIKWRLKSSKIESNWDNFNVLTYGQTASCENRLEEMWFHCGMCERGLGVFNDAKLNLNWQGGRVAKIAIVTLGCLNKSRSSTSDSPVLAHSYTTSYDNQLALKRDGLGETHCLHIWMFLLWKAHWACPVTCHKIKNNSDVFP